MTFYRYTNTAYSRILLPFGSEESCCEGASSTYHERVGRSTKLLGPYMDKQGNNLLTGNYGEIILHGNNDANGFAGPGHNAEIINRQITGIKQ